MEIVVDIISGDRKINALMHAGDVFEKGKILGNYSQFVVKGTDKIRIRNVTKNVAKAFEEGGDQIVSFVGIRSIDGEQSKSPIAYLKPGVQSISDGKNWDLLKNLLNRLGYSKIETTQYMEVTSVNW